MGRVHAHKELPHIQKSGSIIKKQDLFHALRKTKDTLGSENVFWVTSVQLNTTLVLKHFTLYVSFFTLALCLYVL